MFQRISKVIAGLILLSAMLTATGAMQHARTHDFVGDLPSFAEFDLNSSNQPDGIMLWTGGKISGFDNHAHIVVILDTLSQTGDFTGTFNAARFIRGPRSNNTIEEDLAGTVSGFSLDNGAGGVAYFATITITGGTERLAGASGTIYLDAYQSAYIDPNIFGNRVPTEMIFNGTYSLP
jgi:hypothetical protein